MPFGGENAESYHDEGLTAMMKGEVNQAMSYFEQALHFNPGLTAAQHQLGKCYFRLGQFDRAAEILGSVIKHKPNQIPLRLDFGHVLLMLDRIAEARREFAFILEIQPNNARAHLGLAQACFYEGQWENAVSLAQTARMVSGANFATLFLLGRAAKLSGNRLLAEESLTEAEALIEKSIESSPDSPEVHYLHGEICFALDRFSTALEHYHAAEERALPTRHYTACGENFTHIDMIAKRASCLQRLGNTEEARKLGEKILTYNPDHKLGKMLAAL